MRTRPPLLPLLLIITLALTFIVPAGRAATVSVTVHNTEFVPSVVNIQTGDTVIWTNVGGTHNVVADDASFSTAGGAAPWSFSHTFTAAGTVPYHCQFHAAFMKGTVIVTDGGGTGNPGMLKLEMTSYSVNEGDSVNVRVLRLNGDDGAASVTYTVSAGTAGNGDFTPATGTFNWADGDSTPRTLSVATTEDAIAESNETVKVTLSNATGASIDNAGKSATVTILDDDAPGSPPTTPANLQAHAHSSTEVMLSWTDASGETGYRVEAKTLGGSYQTVDTPGQNQTDTLIGGLEPATLYTFRVRAENSAGNSAYSNEAEATTNAPVIPCVPSATALCLNQGRFQVQVAWHTADQNGVATAVPIESAPDSGLFYFFGSSNIEMLVKVLNACVPALGNKYWVFFAATTNVEFTMTVTDTQNGVARTYHNPLGMAALPVQDTNAFATCP